MKRLINDGDIFDKYASLEEKALKTIQKKSSAVSIGPVIGISAEPIMEQPILPV